MAHLLRKAFIMDLALQDFHLGETLSVEFLVHGKLANLLISKPASYRSSLLHKVQRAVVDQDLHLVRWVIEWRRALFQAAPVDRTGPKLQRGERGRWAKGKSSGFAVKLAGIRFKFSVAASASSAFERGATTRGGELVEIAEEGCMLTAFIALKKKKQTITASATGAARLRTPTRRALYVTGKPISLFRIWLNSFEPSR
eukprot:174896-Prorocentrum_minimum.AAC.4